MSTAVAPAPQVRGAIIPQSDTETMRAISQMVDGYRSSLADPDLASLEKMLIQARAIAALEGAISDHLLTDVMKLQGSPLGFKTDLDSKGGYPRDTVKRVMIVAWLLGANMTGNEVNIIAGNCYLTKKFTFPQIMRTPGISNLAVEIGVPMRHGDKTAAFDARAQWMIHGELYELNCIKSPDGFDGRIVVKAYESSSPDELRGKAEAKLYQRILQRITGIGLYDPDDPANLVDAPSAVPSEVSKIEAPEVADEVPGQPKLSDAEAARFLVESFQDQVRLLASINDVKRAHSNQEKLLGTSDWSDSMKQETALALQQAMNGRIEEIRASRGESSNRG